MSDITDFKDLRIWQKGMNIAEKEQNDRYSYEKAKTINSVPRSLFPVPSLKPLI